MQNTPRILIAYFVLIILASMATFTVDQREHGIVFRLGEIVAVKEGKHIAITCHPELQNETLLHEICFKS